MKILIADESVQQQADHSKFFIFGAIIISSGKVPRLTDGIEKIRNSYGFSPEGKFKFSPNDCPKEIGLKDLIDAKREALKLANKCDVKFIGYAILHAIAKNNSPEALVTKGADSVLTKYQQYLVETGRNRGIALFDTLPIPHPNRYLRSSFQMRLSHENEGHRLPNVDLISGVTDGCSHLTSVCDICTGSFSYIVNEPKRDKAGKELTKLLKPLFWTKAVRRGKRRGRQVSERGLLLRPREVKADQYKAEYEELRDRIINWANE